MSDIVERAEAMLSEVDNDPWCPDCCWGDFVVELVAALKVERAKNERLQAHFDRAMGAK